MTSPNQLVQAADPAVTKAPAQVTARRGQRALWALSSWRWAFPAALVSRLGDVVFDVTVLLWVGQGIGRGQDWAPMAASGVAIAAGLPVLLVAPIAGVVIDKFDRRRIMVATNLIQSIAIGSLVLLATLPELPTGLVLTWVYAAVVVSNVAAQFFSQARLTMIAATIDSDLQTRAQAAQMSASSVITMVCPPLAGPLYFVAGAGWAMGVNAASYLVSTLLLSRVRWDSGPRPEAAGQSFGASLRQGWTTVRGDVLLRTVVLGLVVASFGSGLITVLDQFFVTDALGQPPASVGWVLGAMAAGSLAGALVAPSIEDRVGGWRSFTSGVVLAGVATLGYSRATDLLLAVLLAFVASVPLGVVNAVLLPVVMRAVDPAVLGRVTTLMTAMPMAASLLSMGLSGMVVSGPMRKVDLDLGITRFGPVDTLFALCGIAFIVTGVLAARRVPAARIAVLAPSGAQ
ncbi:MFS transporter [Dermacoccaceae bacterium W4C1]